MIEDFLKLLPYLLQGMVVTLKVTFVSLSFGFVIGILLAIMRVYGGKVFVIIATIYSTVMRAIPVLLVVLILYFVITSIINLPAFWAGSLALAFASGAYQSEILRGAFLSIPKGQMMAARSIGMTRIRAIRFIIIPQALRLAITPWSNEAAILLKDSSLVYVLGVPEILRQAQYFSARTYEPFLAFGSAALIYFILTFITNRGLEAVQRHYMIPTSLSNV